MSINVFHMTSSALNSNTDNHGVDQGKPLHMGLPKFPYTLVFLDATKDLPQGSEKLIQAPYVSLGRDSDCLISYGDEFPMVSRLHAAIEWNEDSYSLRHLSNTNQTLLNGRPIAKKWFLRDDDEIQLAPSGPKIKFKMPLILSMQPAKAKAKANGPALPAMDMQNIAIIVLIVLSVLLVTLMVYLTISD